MQLILSEYDIWMNKNENTMNNNTATVPLQTFNP